jgi:plasmid stabilization system protein ParE
MNESSLSILFGSRAAEAVLLHLLHYGETYGRAAAADMEASLESVQRQLDKFERAGVLVSKLAGRTRLYSWNEKSPIAARVRDLVKVVYDAIPLRRRAQIFQVRRRPRAKGKAL